MLNKQSTNEHNLRSISYNSVWNLIGQIIPLIAAIFAIPILIKGLGVDSFGVLTIAWMVIGYFSLFDFGLGRTLTKMISEKVGVSGEIQNISKIIHTALVIMLVFSLAGTAVLLLICEWLVKDVLIIPNELHQETLLSFKILAWSLPFVILSAGLRGVLEAYHRFDLVNIIRIPQGALIFLSPLVILPFSSRLDLIVLLLAILRVLFCMIYALICEKILPGILQRFTFSKEIVRPLLSFGGWMTVSNIVGPVMVYLDRFFIGSVLGVAAVAYYVTPYEIITKLWIIPGALVGVLFPIFSSSALSKLLDIDKLFIRSVRWIFFVLFPTTLLVVTYSNEGLHLWLSSEFASKSSLVLQILALGIFVNSLSHVPFAYIQSVGRPDLTAKLHIIELPFYIFFLWLFMKNWGIVGAAAAWSLRVCIDALLIFIVSCFLNNNLTKKLKFEMPIILFSVLIILLSMYFENIFYKTVYTLISLLLFIILCWNYLLYSEDKSLIKRYLKLK